MAPETSPFPATLDAPLPAASFLACAPWTKAQGADPIGSATRIDTFLLVETPLPWPRDVGLVPSLAGYAKRDPLTRVLSVVPQVANGQDGLTTVVRWRRVGFHRFEGVDYRVPTERLADLLEVSFAEPDQLDAWAVAAPTVRVAPARRDLLICTHGRRDRCCGGTGTALYATVADRWDGVRVWRSSHLGGHRYAPTAVSLPEGRFWAHLDRTVLDGVIDRSVDAASLARHQRGSSALEPRAQIVERALFSRFGWDWFDADITDVAIRDVTTDAASPRFEVVLDWTSPGGAPTGSATATVVVARQIAVPVCGEDPAQAEDTHPEYELEALSVIGV
jgi:hypothetical protein